MEGLIYWLTSIIALAGVWLNIKKHVACFWLWGCTNAVWVYADLKHGLAPQAALQAIYFVLSVYGIYRWSAGAETKPSRLDRGAGV